jgi:GT2 family glycosyltransferase
MASAACMMVRRKFFEELGGFDDRLPLGYEDVEICWRARAQDVVRSERHLLASYKRFGNIR